MDGRPFNAPQFNTTQYTSWRRGSVFLAAPAPFDSGVPPLEGVHLGYLLEVGLLLAPCSKGILVRQIDTPESPEHPTKLHSRRRVEKIQRCFPLAACNTSRQCGFATVADLCTRDGGGADLNELSLHKALMGSVRCMSFVPGVSNNPPQASSLSRPKDTHLRTACQTTRPAVRNARRTQEPSGIVGGHCEL